MKMPAPTRIRVPSAAGSRRARERLRTLGGDLVLALAPLATLALLVLLAPTASAQAPILYKVIGPDGKVTYTDRPAPGTGRAAPVGSSTGSAPTPEAPLPIELRQPVARYPVTLYLTDLDCDACVAARQLLRQRGIPYSERLVSSEEDIRALERLTGGRDAPTLTIGSQVLRGLAPELWRAYLDAAGYPRESRLPANYPYPPATPLVARAPVAPPSAPASSARDDAPTVPELPNASGIRF